MVKKILLFVVGLIVLLLLIGFVLPRKFELTKSEVINAPADYVFEEINNLERWPDWSYWNTLDPNMEVKYSEQKAGTGASYEWKGNSDVGEGKLAITESKPNESVACDLFFMQAEDASKASYHLEPAEGGTKLTMNFDTDFGMNPIMRWMGVVMFPSEMNKAFDYNFSKLKEIAEAKPKFTVTISEETINPISYIGISTTMSFDTDFGMNPIMRWMGVVMFPSEMNTAFDHNLSKLKEIAEAKPKFTVTISEETTNPISYIGISTTMSFEDGDAISAQMGKSYGELMGVLQKAKVEIAGAPFCLYPRWDEEKKEMDMVCALPVPADAKLPAKYPVMQTTGGHAVKAIHLGDYHKLNDTHDQINQYIQYKKLEIVGAPWEVFITDPEMEMDTTKWVTEVFYPVKG